MLAILTLVALASAPQEVRILDVERGCYGEAEREDVWKIQAEQLVCGERSLPLERLETLRQLVLSAQPETSFSAGRLLDSVGITSQTVAAHRDSLLEAALPSTWKPAEGLPQLPAFLEPLLRWKALRDPLARELAGANWSSTLTYRLEVRLPGEPEILLTSQGLTPWMLPWDIQVGRKTWRSPDVRISRALLEWVAPDGPCGKLLDGTAYWQEGIYSDRDFARRWIGAKLDAAFSNQAYAALEGWEPASALLRVDKVMTGNVNMQPESMFFELSSRYPATIDALRWWNPLDEGVCTRTWHDVLGAWRDGTLAVERESWLGEWKRAGPARGIGLDVVGRTAISAILLEKLVLPAWHHAGFTGQPDFELLLRREGRWTATVFLARGQAGGLITTAHRGEGQHWLDAQEFSFHPRSDPPTYGRVDAAGRFELRTLR